MSVIKQGYKQTKVGIIPEDWEVVKLSSFIEELEAGVSVNSTDEPCEEKEYGILKTSAISNGNFIYKENKKIKNDELHRAKLNPTKGCLLISRMNTPDLVGAIGLVTNTYPNLFLPDRLWQTKFSSDCKIDSFWLNSLLNTNQYKLLVQSLATGTSNSMKNISKKAFLEIDIPLPPLKEQEKIAEILTTWDEAIIKQEELIKSKELQKKALMQKLLSGEVRFDGFSDKWEEVRLGEVCDCLDNMRKPLNDEERQKIQGNIPYWGANNIMDYINNYIFNETIVLLAEDGGNFNEYNTRPIANISYGKCWVNNHTHVLRGKNNILINEFLFYSLVHKNITGYVGGGTRSKLTKSEMLKIQISMPSLPEQQKIAEVLSLADDEINLLKNELEELKLQKKALMQKLLTGEVRVKV